jgi:hypothetical protein
MVGATNIDAVYVNVKPNLEAAQRFFAPPAEAAVFPELDGLAIRPGFLTACLP